ncbi:sensor histidine kinase [Streptomyces sp. R41]|uniref:histidine kinase n=1 Tax=Streptomyces sp. R41 TaxID=3238632 RepID=A0AB39RFF3_9ACTN
MDSWDVFTGCALLASGAVCVRRRAGLPLIASGVCWFLGDVVGWAVFVHRGVLFFLVLTCPAVRLGSGGRSYGEGARGRRGTLSSASGERPRTVTPSTTSVRTTAWKLGSRTRVRTVMSGLLGRARVRTVASGLLRRTRVRTVASALSWQTAEGRRTHAGARNPTRLRTVTPKVPGQTRVPPVAPKPPWRMRLRLITASLPAQMRLPLVAPVLGPAVVACCTALYPLTRIDAVAVVEVAALVGGAGLRLRATAAGAHERRARGIAFAAAVLLAGAVVWGVVARRSGVAGDLVVLRTYELVVAVAGGALCAGALLSGSARAALTRLVVDLGEPAGGGPLRARLAPVLGDPGLELGYWVPELGGYVDEAGRPVRLPPAGAARVVTPLEQDGRPLAVLVHDGSMPHDRALLSAVAAVARLAVSNARLQAEIRGRLAELESSRRRLVEAADTERRRLERQLDEDVLHRLDRAAEVLADSGDWAGPVLDALRAAHAELREFARGIHPATLVRDGLAAALGEQTAQCPLPLTLDVPEGRFDPAVEAAAYFICCEALTNAVKHAHAGRVSVRVTARPDGGVEVEVRDDGAGGARPELGTGLRGLADRAEALGGTLRVENAPGGGTWLFAQIPQGIALGAGARDSGAGPDVREVSDPYRRNRSEQSAGGE